MSRCRSASGGLGAGIPPQLWWERVWAAGRCACPGAPRPRGGRELCPPQVPCSPRGASCLNRVLAPRRPPRLSLREGPPRALAGVGPALAWLRRAPVTLRQHCQRCSQHAPPALRTSLLARKKVPVPFIFLHGDRRSVPWFAGVALGLGCPAAPCAGAGGLGDGWRGGANRGGERFSLPPGSSLVAGIVPFPPKDFMTDVLSCF